MRPSASAPRRAPHREYATGPRSHAEDHAEGGSASVSRRLVDRRRSVIAARHRRRRTVLLGGVALAAAASGAWWVATGPLMTVAHVDVAGYDRPDQARIVRAVQLASAGADALHLPAARIEQALAGAPWVAGVEVRRDLPRGLVVRITTATPGAVAVSDNGERYVVSRTGRVLATEPAGASSQMPEIRVARARVGDWLTTGGGRAALTVAIAMSPDVASRVRDLRVADGVLSGRLTDGVEVRFGQPIELRQKARALDAILASPLASADLAEAKYIDLTVPARPIMGGVTRPTTNSTTSQGSDSATGSTQP